MCKSLTTNNNNINLSTFNHVTSSSGTNKPGTRLTKAEYTLLATSIVNCYETNGRNAKNLNYKNRTMNFDDTVHIYSRILRYKYLNSNAPSYATILALTNKDYSTETTALQSTSTQELKITATCKNNNNGTYNLTLTPSQIAKICYTRNGSTPTKNDKIYTSGEILELGIKTQLRAILIDTNNKTSETVFYQAPRIITPPITIIKPITGLNNNQQKIQFITNNQNATIYYTTDGTNPQKSNTTKKTTPQKQITIHKNTVLTYYTTDNQGYTSTNYIYRTPKHQNERPTITIINTTGIYNDGTQRIMIQSNQPGKFNTTEYNGNETPIERKNIDGEIKITKNTRIQIITQYTGKYSKIVEYNPINGTQVVMNYNYTIKLPNVQQYEYVFFYCNNMEYSYSMNK